MAFQVIALSSNLEHRSLQNHIRGIGVVVTQMLPKHLSRSEITLPLKILCKIVLYPLFHFFQGSGRGHNDLLAGLPVNRTVEAALGERPIQPSRLQGLAGLPERVDGRAHEITLANPAWSHDPMMARADHLDTACSRWRQSLSAWHS